MTRAVWSRWRQTGIFRGAHVCARTATVDNQIFRRSVIHSGLRHPHVPVPDGPAIAPRRREHAASAREPCASLGRQACRDRTSWSVLKHPPGNFAKRSRCGILLVAEPSARAPPDVVPHKLGSLESLPAHLRHGHWAWLWRHSVLIVATTCPSRESVLGVRSHLCVQGAVEFQHHSLNHVSSEPLIRMAIRLSLRQIPGSQVRLPVPQRSRAWQRSLGVRFSR